MKKVEKPWGEEIWLVYNNDKYAGKIIKVNKGHRLSLQYHRKKHESLYLDKGIMKLTLENDKGILEEKICHPGFVVDIPAGKKHRIEAIENCKLFEISTPELDDVVRIEDDYNRIG